LVIDPRGGFFNAVKMWTYNVRNWERMLKRFPYAFAWMATVCAFAQGPRKPKTEVTEIRATGCVRQAAQSHCLLLETLDGGTTYTFLAAPQPELGTVITIAGKQHEGRSACKQGIPIDITDWEPTGETCVQSKPK
jgi:hypothetical protein